MTPHERHLALEHLREACKTRASFAEYHVKTLIDIIDANARDHVILLKQQEAVLRMYSMLTTAAQDAIFVLNKHEPGLAAIILTRTLSALLPFTQHATSASGLDTQERNTHKE